MDIAKNTVSAQNQVGEKGYGESFCDGGLKVLFVGNSITRHGPKPEIGWENDWGMAATAKENDYVHITIKMLEERYGKVSYFIANCGEWESNYYKDDIICKWQKARDFKADVVVIRIGENMWVAKEMFEKEPIAPHFAKMIEYFCSNENAKVVLTNLFWRSDVIDSAIAKVEKDKGYTLVELGDLGDCEENKAIGKFAYSAVSLHPNDKGTLLYGI